MALMRSCSTGGQFAAALHTHLQLPAVLLSRCMESAEHTKRAPPAHSNPPTHPSADPCPLHHPLRGVLHGPPTLRPCHHGGTHTVLLWPGAVPACWPDTGSEGPSGYGRISSSCGRAWSSMYGDAAARFGTRWCSARVSLGDCAASLSPPGRCTAEWEPLPSLMTGPQRGWVLRSLPASGAVRVCWSFPMAPGRWSSKGALARGFADSKGTHALPRAWEMRGA